MATTTPNFGWPVPTSTDLVKDGATAIEALGDSIDASLVDLKGGTTGQVLSKNSNTDMDFVWVTDAGGDITGVTAGTGISGGGTSGTVTVTNSMATAIDAKGDLIAGTGADAFARLAVGTDGQVLTADSTAATGIKWATTASTSGLTLISAQSFTSASTVDFSNTLSSTYDNYVMVSSFQASDNGDLNFRYRVSGADNTTTNYNYQLGDLAGTSSNIARITGQTNGRLAGIQTGVRTSATSTFFMPFASVNKNYTSQASVRTDATTYINQIYGAFNASTSFTGLTVYPSSGTITGSIRLYGYQL